MLLISCITLLLCLTLGGASLTPCPQHAPTVSFHPSEDDCSSYWVCRSGNGIKVQCPSGLHFDVDRITCDVPQQVKCLKSPLQGTKVESSGDFSHQLCPSEDSEEVVLFPHQRDCSLYYICQKGTARLAKCPDGLHFNRKLNVCDYPERAKCREAPLQVAKVEKRDDFLLRLCPSEDSGELAFFPHPLDCSLYYLCRKGTAQLAKCPDGLHFNQKLNVCDYPERAECIEVLLQKTMVEKSDGFLHPLCPSEDPKEPVHLPHPSDCGKFYICHRGKAFVKTCRPGLHFNRKLNVCDYPERAGCVEGRDPKEQISPCSKVDHNTLTFLPHPTDCSKYLSCRMGSAETKECSEGLHFNAKIEACDLPENAECDGTLTSIITEPPLRRTTPGKDDGFLYPLCPSEDPKEPVHLPHPSDCGKFYICHKGKAFVKTCRPGLHFNRKLNVCDYPDRAGCVEGRDPKEQISPCSKVDHYKLTFLPHPTDCSKYLSCRMGSAETEECSVGLHFNAKIEACDLPENAECDRTFTSIITEPPLRRTTAGKDDGFWHPLCPSEDPKDPVHLPHLLDCGKFYICHKGKAFVKTCRPGLHFNRKLNVCDYPDKAGCMEDRKPKEEITPCSQVNPNHITFLPHPTDCSQFLVCQNGSAKTEKCEEGLHFNAKLQACDFPEEAKCDETFTSETGITESTVESTTVSEATGSESPLCPLINGKYPVFFRHDTNCSVYYMCGNGIAYEFSCPNSMHFNLEKETCDWPYRAGCRKDDDSDEEER